MFGSGVEHGVETEVRVRWPGSSSVWSNRCSLMGLNTVEVPSGSVAVRGVGGERSTSSTSYGVAYWVLNRGPQHPSPVVIWATHAARCRGSRGRAAGGDAFHPEKSGDAGCAVRNWLRTLEPDLHGKQKARRFGRAAGQARALKAATVRPRRVA